MHGRGGVEVDALSGEPVSVVETEVGSTGVTVARNIQVGSRRLHVTFQNGVVDQLPVLSMLDSCSSSISYARSRLLIKISNISFDL